MPTRRDFVRTLFAAGQGAVVAGLLAAGEDPLRATERDEHALNFLAFGDWGVQGAPPQTRVAAQMARAATASRARFMFALGDNFYETGVTSSDDPQWQSSFENVYGDPALHLPCYAILGNHDYGGNCDAQIEYGRTHPRWIMPARYYMRTMPMLGHALADFFFLDTSPFISEYRAVAATVPNATPSQRKGAAVMEQLRIHVASQNTEAQLKWLRQALTQSRAEWKIVVGHHPIYSGGLHRDSPDLIARLLPLLREHGVQVYLAGHDHDLQHLHSGEIDFLCSGAGGASLYPLHATNKTKFARETFGFMSCSLSTTVLKVRMIDDTGAVVYETAIPQKRSAASST